MKKVVKSNIDCSNWTKGKEYDVKPSFVQGYALIIDDYGAEQLIRFGDTAFIWSEKQLVYPRIQKTDVV